MATYANIGNQIESIIRVQVSNVNYVYPYARKNPEGYPAITIEGFDGDGEFADTSRNKRSFMFRLTVLQERLSVGENQAEIVVKGLIDQLLSTFDDRSNLTLNNSCIFAYPIPSKWGYIQAPDIDIRSAEIILTAVDVV